jgi:AraC-like DNA-binding protein
MTLDNELHLGFDIGRERVRTDRGVLEDCSTDGLHRHPFHQVLVIRNGVSLFHLESCTLPQYGHTAAFIPAGQLHRTVVLGSEVLYETVYFHRRYLLPACRGVTMFTMGPLGLALMERLCGTEKPDMKNRHVRECFSLLVHEMKSGLGAPADIVTLPAAQGPAGKSIAEFIHGAFRQKLTLDRIASCVPYTSRHAARLFAADLGVSVFTYVRLYRMLRASIMLQLDDNPVIDIALECGYDSLSSFYADFRRHFGASPSAFRRMSRRGKG